MSNKGEFPKCDLNGPEYRSYKAIITDTSWAAYICSTKPIMLINSEGKLVEGEDVHERRSYNHNGSHQGELAVNVDSEGGSKILELQRWMYDRNKIFINNCDLGTFTEWQPDISSKVYMMAFVHNVSESQAATIAEDCSFKFWFTPRGYHEGNEFMRADMNGVMFMDEMRARNPNRPRRGSARTFMPDGSFDWVASDKDREWVNKYVNGPAGNCLPGSVALSFAPRMLAQKLAKTKFAHLVGEEREEAIRGFISSQVKGGFTLPDMMTRYGVPLNDVVMGFPFILPLHPEK